MKLAGRVWKFGDGLGLFDILPARFDDLGVNEKWDECGARLFEDIAPRFAADHRPGDIVIAGADLGIGHAHYYRATILACKAGGVAALLGESTANLFQRGAIDQGLPVWAYPGIGDLVNDGERLEMDLATGGARNADTGAVMTFKPLAPVILDILAADGAFNWAKARAHQRVSA